MRISTNTIFNQNVTQLDTLSSNLQQTQQQVSSGQRILTPSDDPAGAALALQITQTSALNAQYVTNIGTTNDAATLTEGTLQGVTSLLQNIQSTAVQAGDPALAASDRATLATNLQSNLTQLLGLANSTDAVGNYLFSGFKGTTQPFVNTANGVQYNGDDGQRLIQVSPNQQVATSSSGADIFMRIKNGNGTFATQATAANTGSGIISQGNVINPAAINGNSYQIAFTSPNLYNVYDTTVATQAAPANTGNGVVSAGSVTNTATFNSDTYQVVFTSPNNYNVFDTTTDPGMAGAPLSSGAYTSGQPISFNGMQLSIQGAPATGDAFIVNSTNTPALLTPPSPGTYVSGQAINVGGMQFDISGTPSGGDSFAVTPSTNESVFQTITNFIALLKNGSATSTQITAGVNSAIGGMNNALNSVLTARASLGARMNDLTALSSTETDLGTQYTQTLSTLQNVDYNKALTQLSAQQIILTAAQKSFTQIQNLSVFDYMR